MFYSREGLVTSVPRKGGGERKPTIKDARAQNLVPRFSSVIKYKSSFALERWQVETAIDLALANPTLNRDEILELADGDRDVTMSKGIEIHRSLEEFFQNGGSMFHGSLGEEIGAYMLRYDSLYPELQIVNDWFGGRADLVALKKGTYSVIDFKTTGDIDKIKAPYDKWILQVCAYAWGIKTEGLIEGENLDNAIVVIDQSTLRWKVLTITQETIETATKEFVAILYAWHIANKLKNPEGLKIYL